MTDKHLYGLNDIPFEQLADPHDVMPGVVTPEDLTVLAGKIAAAAVGREVAVDKPLNPKLADLGWTERDTLAANTPKPSWIQDSLDVPTAEELREISVDASNAKIGAFAILHGGHKGFRQEFEAARGPVEGPKEKKRKSILHRMLDDPTTNKE